MIQSKQPPILWSPAAKVVADPIWLISLTDLAGLMVVFFVMLFAMSALDQGELERVVGTSVVGPVVEAASGLVVSRLPPASDAEGRDPNYLASVIRAKFENEPQLKDLMVRDLGDRAIIFVPTARLEQESRSGAGVAAGGLIHSLAGALRTLPNRISVDARFAGASAAANPERWRAALMVAYRAARALEKAGLPGPVGARAMVGPETGQSGLHIVIFAAGSPSPESVLR